MDGGANNQIRTQSNVSHLGPFLLGCDYVKYLKEEGRRYPITWSPNSLSNHHVAILGTSGSGKTTFIRKFIAGLPPDVEVDILDYHGDIDPSIDECRSALYSERTRYGFNPLQINLDPDYGGVRRAIRDVIGAFDNTSNRLGTRQAELLRSLLLDVYESRGILEDDPSTWSKRVGTSEILDRLKSEGNTEQLQNYYPTLGDVHDLAQRRLFSLMSGVDDVSEGRTALNAFDQYRREVTRFHRLATKYRRGDYQDAGEDKALDTLNRMRSACADALVLFLEKMETGREVDEASVYSNKEVLIALISRLRSLVATGLFEPNPPPFGHARIRRHNLRPLAQSPEELNMFIRLRLQHIIKSMMQDGHVDGRLRRLVILDESKPFCSEDIDNPINIIATQMRKFGLGLLLASQSIHHLSQDFVKNAATILLLDADTHEWDAVSRSLRLPVSILKLLKHHELAAVRMRQRNGVGAAFQGLYLK